jgi:hypothetical protein
MTMANSLGTNPIYLDTFTGDIDIGASLFGQTEMIFNVKLIKWNDPTTQAHTAVITDGRDVVIFSETVSATVPEHHESDFHEGQTFFGLKVATGAVDSGSISIFLK